jgi:hypothetical protein
MACKPGFVFAITHGDGYSSRSVVANTLMQPTRIDNLVERKGAEAHLFLFGLASGGVFPATPVTRRAVRSYRTFSPLPICVNI